MPAAASLFGTDIPEGFLHRDDFVSPDEAARLVRGIQRIAFATFEMWAA